MKKNFYFRYVLDFFSMLKYIENSECNTQYIPNKGHRTVNGFCYIESGEAIFHDIDNGCSHTAQTGDIIFIPVNSRYMIDWQKGCNCYYTINFILSKRCCISDVSRGTVNEISVRLETADTVPPFLSPNRLKVIRIGSRDVCRMTITELYDTYCSDDDYMIFCINKYFFDFLSYIHDEIQQNQEADDANKAMDTARIYIENHCMDELSIDKLSQMCSMSRSYFSHKFKSVYGMSPMNYRNYIRIRLASAMLRNSDLTVEQIWQMLNFSSASHFRKIFTHINGIPPKKYSRLDNGKNFGVGTIRL